MNIIGPYRPYTYRPYQRNMVQSLSRPGFCGVDMSNVRQTTGQDLNTIREVINDKTVPEYGEFEPCVVSIKINDAFAGGNNSTIELNAHDIVEMDDKFKKTMYSKELTITFVNGRTGLTASSNRLFKDRETLFKFIDEELDINRIVLDFKKETSGN